MATTPTNKPIPSEDPRDLKFNAGKIDEVVNSDAHYYTDRFGVHRWTIAGFQYTAEEAIRNYGYITMDSFEDGATLTLPNQTLRYEATGEYYRWDGEFPKTVSVGSTPETAGGIGIGAWVSVGDAALRTQLASTAGADLVGIMPYGTVQDAIKWVVPEVFPGSNASEKLQAAVNYAVANKTRVVASGVYDVTAAVTIPGDIIIDASSGEFTFNGIDYIFHPLGAKSVEIIGGKFTANAYHTQRPQVIFNDYPDGLANLPTRVVLKDMQCFNCGVGYIMVNCQDPTSVHVSVDNNYCKTDDNTDQYISDAGMSGAQGEVYPYLMILGNTNASVDIGTPRKSMFHVTNNTFDVFMQSGANSDLGKIGGATVGGNVNGNLFCNRNTECACEFDTFTGGLEVSLTSNRFVNTAIKMMSLQFDSSTRVGLGGRSSISNNVFHFEENPLNDFAIFLRTSLVSISNNVFYYKGATNPSEQRIFNFIAAQALNNSNNGFNGTWCAGISITGNTMQMVLDPAVNRSLRFQCINPTDMSGAVISGNFMAGGVGMVLNARPERNRNVWTGNYITSELFTAEDIWRMNSAFVGSGNYIGSGYDNTTTGIPMLTKYIPNYNDGDTIRIPLDRQILTGSYGDRALYYLHIKVVGNYFTNYQTFLVESGAHMAQDLKEAIDSRLNPLSTDAAVLQNTFRVGYDGNGYIVLQAKGTYSSGNKPPMRVDYQIVPANTNFPTLSAASEANLRGMISAIKASSSPVKIAVYGDSTVDGYNTSGWTANPVDSSNNAIGNSNHNLQSPNSWATLLDTKLKTINPQIKVYNAGYGSRAIQDDWAINNYDRAITNNPFYGKCDYCFVAFGLNDRGRSSWDPGEYKKKYIELINFIKSKGTSVIVVNADPARRTDGGPTFGQYRDELIPLQLQVANETGSGYIDMFYYMDSLNPRPAFDSIGVHYGDSGNVYKADFVVKLFNLP